MKMDRRIGYCGRSLQTRFLLLHNRQIIKPRLVTSFPVVLFVQLHAAMIVQDGDHTATVS